VRFYKRHAIAIFWAVVVIVYALAIMPAPRAPDLGAGDKINHVAAFLTLSLLGRYAYRGDPVWRLALGLSLFGALIELTQAIPVLRRDASFWDWVADSTAVLLALAVSLVVERRFRSRTAA
jgi:hypothetical protein